MLATTKIVRNFARAINGGGFGYEIGRAHV